MSFPNATFELPGNAVDPFLDESSILQPIITPITSTDEILGQDKRKVHFSDGPRNTSVACLKDGKVLRQL